MKRQSKDRPTRKEAKQIRSVLTIRRGEHGEEARQALHEFNGRLGGYERWEEDEAARRGKEHHLSRYAFGHT